MRAEILKKHNKMDEVFTPLKEIRSTVKGNFQIVKKNFEDLEWRLQTSSLDPKEENRLIAQVKELEIQLAKHQKVNELQSAINDQKGTLDTLKKHTQSVHQKVITSAELSAKFHEEMMQLVNRLKGIKNSADEAHQMYLQVRTETERTEQELLRKVLEKKKLQKEIFGDIETERLRKRKEFVEKLAESGSAKLNQGKKLSLEEFKALMEQKKIYPVQENEQNSI